VPEVSQKTNLILSEKLFFRIMRFQYSPKISGTGITRHNKLLKAFLSFLKELKVSLLFLQIYQDLNGKKKNG